MIQKIRPEDHEPWTGTGIDGSRMPKISNTLELRRAPEENVIVVLLGYPRKAPSRSFQGTLENFRVDLARLPYVPRIVHDPIQRILEASPEGVVTQRECHRSSSPLCPDIVQHKWW